MNSRGFRCWSLAERIGLGHFAPCRICGFQSACYRDFGRSTERVTSATQATQPAHAQGSPQRPRTERSRAHPMSIRAVTQRSVSERGTMWPMIRRTCAHVAGANPDAGVSSLLVAHSSTTTRRRQAGQPLEQIGAQLFGRRCSVELKQRCTKRRPACRTRASSGGCTARGADGGAAKSGRSCSLVTDSVTTSPSQTCHISSAACEAVLWLGRGDGGHYGVPLAYQRESRRGKTGL